MYLVKIKTNYNTIELEVDDMNTPEMQEILNQPYIEDVNIQSMEQYTKDEMNKLLNHVVGMSYNTEKVLELKKKLDTLGDKQ